MTEFKKGDRVKVEFEGVVKDVGTQLLGVVVGGIYRSVEQSDATLLERSVEPLAVGSVVRGTAGQIWYLGRDAVAFVSSSGESLASTHTPETLAGDVARGLKTLIHDGSKK